MSERLAETAARGNLSLPTVVDAIRIECEYAQKVAVAAGRLALVFYVNSLRLAADFNLEAFLEAIHPTRERLVQTLVEAASPDHIAEARKLTEDFHTYLAELFQNNSRILFAFNKLEADERKATKPLESPFRIKPENASPTLASAMMQIEQAARELIEKLNACNAPKFAERKQAFGMELLTKFNDTFEPSRFDAIVARARSLTEPRFLEGLRVIQVATASELQPIPMPWPAYIDSDILKEQTAIQASFLLGGLLCAYSKPPDRQDGKTYPEYAVFHFVELGKALAGVHEDAAQLHSRIEVERIKAERWLVDHADQTVTSETANADATPSPATADQDKPGHTAVAHPPTESGFVWMTAAEAARYVGVTPRTIRNWITGRTGGIETFGDNGRSYRFSQAELDAKKAVRSAENNPKK